MLCCLSCCVLDIFGCYVDCHIVYLTYLDVMLLVMSCVQHIWMLCCLSCCVFDRFGCYVDCHIVYLTYLDVMLLVMLCF